FGSGRYQTDLPAKDISVLNVLDAADLERLSPYLETQVFDHGDAVIRQGARADAIYFIQRGQADIEVTFGDGVARNLGILCPGAIFGEMAVLDGKPRSATILADGELGCLRLSIANLEKLGTAHPEVRHALMAAIGLELSKRIRISNQALSALKA
ncbi:MAG: cyclic nucleotide-binding domain-containing protein, partial [Rhizobiaceae bacterium]|nr:cyclic nucleotide-binding domain-containing protein [Rhizobiaceae bacterium]